jgi:hypothetical protein
LVFFLSTTFKLVFWLDTNLKLVNSQMLLNAAVVYDRVICEPPYCPKPYLLEKKVYCATQFLHSIRASEFSWGLPIITVLMAVGRV